ncbi:hypothetical protein C0989_011584 [Termitomyces sp. Mn162]|nr:hypothetical protein C0989_011584 [Termitomyces sp. Mn162]
MPRLTRTNVGGRIEGLAENNAEPLDSDWPPFTESIRNASQKLFEAYGPVYGLLEGDKARDAFLMFDLTPKDIWKIWDVADTRKRGALDKYDFALAFYLIQCVQTGELSTIPPTTPPQVYRQILSASVSPRPPPPNVTVQPRKPARPPPLPVQTLTVPLEKSPLSAPVVTNIDSWDVGPSVRATAEQHFDKLDTLKVGYIEEDIVAEVMRGFKLIPEDLAQIRDLADLSQDSRLTRDEFVIAMHLIDQRINGVELPAVLPTSLMPPSVRHQYPDIPLRRSATSLGCPKSVVRPHSVTTSGSLPLPPEPSYPDQRHSVPASKAPVLWNHHSIAIPPVREIDVEPPPVVNSQPRLQTISFQQSRAIEQQHDYLSSEVEKLSVQISDPFVASDHVSLEQYRSLEEKNSHLSANIMDLMSQIDTLHTVRSQNETLSQDKARLLVQIREMEQITSDLLQSNEAISRVEQLEVNNVELARRVSELEQLGPQLEGAIRRLNNALAENRDLRQRLQEARELVVTESRRAAVEVENMKKNLGTLEKDKESLQKRAETLHQAIMKAASHSKVNPETEILMDDITRENESLKQRLRQMENSTANLLLSTNGHTEQEKLRRVNQHLTSQIHDLEQLVAELQRSSEEIELQRVLRDVTAENDQLKGSLRETELEVTRLQQTARQVEPLEAKVEELQAEIHRLHAENLRAQAQAEGSSVPPPAYDDDPFH